MIYDIYSSEEFSRTLKGACEVIFLDPDRDNRYVLHLQSIFISLFIIGLVILQPFLMTTKCSQSTRPEMLAAKRHTGAHSPVSGAKTIIANSNQFAYAA
jgi:hypothetical protein